MPLHLTDDKSTLVQVMAWCRQATSHYLSQCWPRLMSPNGITRPQWVKLHTQKQDMYQIITMYNTSQELWMVCLLLWLVNMQIKIYHTGLWHRHCGNYMSRTQLWIPQCLCHSSFKLRLHRTRQAVWLRRDSRAAKIETEEYNRSVYTATRCTQQTRDCCEPRRQFKFELIIAARHMLSRAVASVFFEEHRPQKLLIHGLYAGVARDNCLPCKRYCRAASRAAACRAACRVPCKRTFKLRLHGTRQAARLRREKET